MGKSMAREMLFVDSCNSFLELDLNESNINKGLLRFKGKFQEAEAVNKNNRIYSYSVLDENVERLQDIIKKRGLVGQLDHPCLTSSNFRVLTVNGWKEFLDIKVGDQVWSRVDGEMKPSTVNAIINNPYDGKAYHVKGNSIDCSFTPNHKFLLNKRQDQGKNKEQFYVTLEEIYNNRKKFSHCPIPKTAKWSGNKNTEFILKGTESVCRKDCTKDLVIDTKKFVGFLGIYLAEGSAPHKHHVEIAQKNEIGRNLIRELLNDFHPDIKWKENKRGFYTCDARLYNFVKPLGNVYTKKMPAEIKELDACYLEEFLYWYAIGDGTMLKFSGKSRKAKNCKGEVKSLDECHRVMVYTVSKQLIEDLHECLTKTGRCGSRSQDDCTEDYVYADRVIKAENKVPLYKLNISKTDFIHLDERFLKINEIHHTGNIYCLTVDHGNFYVEIDGHCFWTGNCDSVIHFKEASHLITKLWWDGNTLMGEGEVLNTPHGKVLKTLLNDGVQVGISSRGVGSGKTNENGILVINENYKLITFDVVADPSCHEAFQEKVIKQENYLPKNNFSSVNKISKEAVLAAVSGIIKNNIKKVKERI